MKRKNSMDPLVRKFLMDKYLLRPEDESLSPSPLRDDPEVESSWSPASAPKSVPPINEPPAPLIEPTGQGSSLKERPRWVTGKGDPSAAIDVSEVSDDIFKPLEEESSGTPSLYYDQSAIDREMREAQSSMRDNLQESNMMRAFSTIGGAIAGVKPDDKFYDNINKQAGLDIELLKDRRKFEVDNINRQQLQAKMDPMSNISKNVRDAYKRMAPELVGKIPDYDNLSAFDIENNLAKPLELYQRAQDRRMQQEMMAGFRQQGIDVRKDELERRREADQRKMAEQAEKKRTSANAVLRMAQTVKTDVKDAIDIIDRTGDGLFSGTTGWGSVKSAIPGTDARILKSKIDSVKGNIGVDSLLEIKRSGAGLGQVPQSQLDMLASLLGNLDQGLPEEELKKVLRRVDRIYSDIVDKARMDLGQTADRVSPESKESSGNEVERITKDGRTAIFDAKTKEFLRFK